LPTELAATHHSGCKLLRGSPWRDTCYSRLLRCLIKNPRSRAHRNFKRILKPSAGLGSARREAPKTAVFARAAPLPAAPALARWRRPQERVKKAEQNFVPVLPGPYVMHSSTAITPRSVWGLKTLHTSTNDHISYRKPTTGTLLLPLAVRMSPAR
jgi:hypothetical protein